MIKNLYDKSNKVINKYSQTTLNNDNHGTAYVEWGGTKKGSDTIVVLTRVSANPPT